MASELKPFSDYLSGLQKNLITGSATELSYYPALRELLESVGEGGVTESIHAC